MCSGFNVHLVFADWIFTDFFLLIIITMIKTAIRSVNSNRRSTPLTPLATIKLLSAELSEWLKDEATIVDTNLSIGLSVVVSVCIQSRGDTIKTRLFF